MAPKFISRNWVRGDSQLLYCTITHNGDVVDITGYTFYFTVKRDWNTPDAEAVIALNITDLTDPTNGKFNINVSSSLTEDLLKNYVYDIRSEDTGGKFITLERGEINFVKDATRRIFD